MNKVTPLNTLNVSEDFSPMEDLLKKAVIAGLLAFLTTMVTGLTAMQNQ